jgi:hypothetical protein
MEIEEKQSKIFLYREEKSIKIGAFRKIFSRLKSVTK